ncbi:Animal haem peroxidase [Bosea lupini]|jgi:hypothetical protein|uniref:Animal haem peroxidase n=1 Tax=Bosea lupini TaxID=1036779 RepID=A0A1H7W5P0_9HYPH|nr:heme peroxidase family protein [Bosea lupini]SEM16297.1 Animal haem peroxidase [Bosea lupini]
MARHGVPPRAPIPDSLRSRANGDPGLFGYIFPSLRPLTATPEALDALAAAMRTTDVIDNPALPAGLTYLAQFIDHDITLDLTSIGEQDSDPAAKENFRTPALDLDSVYGFGQDGSPSLFERDPVTRKTLPTLLLGTAAESPDLQKGPGNLVPAVPGGDLPRSPVTGLAIIPDSRNDENLLVAQMHLAFMHFHNKVVAHLRAQNVPEGQLFDKAREQVIWHYQWMVLHEFLEHLTGEVGITDRIMRRGRRFYRFRRWPFMPMEFSAAAYRLGHSMVREVYSHNRIFRPAGGIPATLELLFHFTAKSGDIVGAEGVKTAPPKPGLPPPMPVLPSNWVIDWRRFFDFGTPPGEPGFEFNASQLIDPLLIDKLHKLPGTEQGPPFARSLAALNLRRGVQKKLASGQAIAKAMGIAALTPQEIATGPDGAVAKANGFDKATPLWYYILKEAQVKSGGLHLGPVGATIVAEVFIGIVQGSKTSYLGAPNGFKPTLGKVPGQFTIVDLLTFAGVTNLMPA